VTVGQRVEKASFSVMNAVLFSIRQIVTAIVSLMMPILYLIIGLWMLFSYVLFGIAVIALFVVDDHGPAWGLMGVSIGLFLLCKMLIYILVKIKFKLG
jgi:hypothetical protein